MARLLLSAWLACAVSFAPPSVARVRDSFTASTGAKTPEGRPKVTLDRLEFPEGVQAGDHLKKHLRRVLGREVRRVEWGAGRKNRIEYRYSVTNLTERREGDVLEVSCTAVGALPGGRTAKSQLTFGGPPSERNRVVKTVLEIVARGVIARLAELERTRRGL